MLERPLLTVLRNLQRIYREVGLIQPCARGYRFSQPLIQEVIYAELAPELRRAIHRGLAEHLEARGEEVDPERLGVHWERAGDRERATPHLLRAARAAAMRQELRRTVDLCERGGLDPGSVDPDHAQAEAETLFHLAACLKDVGRPDDVESVYAAVLDAADAAGDTRLMQRAQVRRARHRFLSRGLAGDEERELERAGEELPDCVERGMAHWILGVVSRNRGRLEEAERRLLEADAIFVRLGIDSYHSSALDELGSVARHAGRVREAEALYEDAARVSAHVGRRMNAAISNVNLVLARFGRGALEGLEERMERSIRELTLEGAVPTAAHARVFLGEIRYAGGDFAGAERTVQDALGILRGTDYRPGIEAARTLEALLLTASGRVEEAAGPVGEASAIAERRKSLAGSVLAMSVEVQRLCLLGAGERARAEAVRTLELAREGRDAQVDTELAIWMGENAVYDPSLRELPGIDDLLGEAPPDAAGSARAARHLMEGARALAAGGPASTLLTAGRGLREAEYGARRAPLQVLAGLLCARGALGEGDSAGAMECAVQARAEAQRIRHVWLELHLHRFLEDELGHGGYAGRRAQLLAQVIGGVSDPDLRRGLERRWTP